MKNNQLGRTRADVGQAHAHFAFIGTQHGIGGGKRLKHRVIYMDSGLVHRCDHVLRGARRGSHHVNPHLEPRRHHSQGIVYARLIVEDEFLRQQMQNFAVGGQGNRARLIHRQLDLIASNLTRPCAQTDAAVAVDSANMSTTDADDCVLHGRAGDIFRGLHGSLNRRHCLFEFNDHTLARSARLGHAVPAIAQADVGNLRHERAGLGAAHINRR